MTQTLPRPCGPTADRHSAGSGIAANRMAAPSVASIETRANAITAVTAAVPAKLFDTITKATAALRDAVITARALRVGRLGPPQAQPIPKLADSSTTIPIQPRGRISARDSYSLT